MRPTHLEFSNICVQNEPFLCTTASPKKFDGENDRFACRNSIRRSCSQCTVLNISRSALSTSVDCEREKLAIKNCALQAARQRVLQRNKLPDARRHSTLALLINRLRLRTGRWRSVLSSHLFTADALPFRRCCDRAAGQSVAGRMQLCQGDSVTPSGRAGHACCPDGPENDQPSFRLRTAR